MFHTSWFENLLQSYLIKKVLHCYTDKYIDQWDRVESTEIIPHTYGQMNFYKGVQIIQYWKDSLFNTEVKKSRLIIINNAIILKY